MLNWFSGDGIMGPALNYLKSVPKDHLQCLQSSKYYKYKRDGILGGLRSPHTVRTKLVVVSQDCLEAAIDLSSDVRSIPAVLNMANEYNCGGGFCSIHGSQEEYLFRNTSLSASLWPHRRSTDQRWPQGSDLLGCAEEAYYPLTECGGIYSPQVEVFASRDKPLDRVYKIAALSIAAQDLRTGRSYNSGATFDFGLLLGKLRTLLLMAEENGHRILVLGAIGCGAFRNPPEMVARAFQLLLGEGGEFAGRFDIVAFAIILSAHNLRTFEAAFGPAVPRAAALLDSLLPSPRQSSGNSAAAAPGTAAT